MQTSASKERRGWEDPLVAQHYELLWNLTYMRSIHADSKDLGTIDFCELSWIPHGSNQQCCHQGFFFWGQNQRGGNFRLHESYELGSHDIPLSLPVELWSCRNQWQHRPPPIAQLWFVAGKEGRFNSHTPTLPVRRSFSPIPRVVKK